MLKQENCAHMYTQHSDNSSSPCANTHTHTPQTTNNFHNLISDYSQFPLMQDAGRDLKLKNLNSFELLKRGTKMTLHSHAKVGKGMDGGRERGRACPSEWKRIFFSQAVIHGHPF